MITRRDKLEADVAKRDEKDHIKPVRMLEIMEIDLEMKCIMFEKLLANNESCPEGLKPSYVTDDQKYMRDYIKSARNELEYKRKRNTLREQNNEPSTEEILNQIHEIHSQAGDDLPPQMEKTEPAKASGWSEKLMFHNIESDRVVEIPDDKKSEEATETETISTQASEEKA